jgi:hypothetical protein
MYSLTDPDPGSRNYYRLKQVDLDGQFNYSHTVEIKLDPTFRCEVFPNPTRGMLYLSMEGGSEKAEMTVTDMSGKMVLRRILSLQTTAQIDVSHLSNGSYFVTIRRGGVTWSEKFLKQ